MLMIWGGGGGGGGVQVNEGKFLKKKTVQFLLYFRLLTYFH